MSVIAIVILLAQNFGLGRVYPWNLIPVDAGRWAWTFLSLGLLVLLVEQTDLFSLGPRWRRVSGTIERIIGLRAALILLLAGNAGFAVVASHHFQALGYKFPWLHLALLGLAVPFVRKDRFWLSCCVSLGLLVASIVHFPVVAARSDYLPGIQHALTGWALQDNALALGGMHQNTTAYLPGVLFSHVPAWILGLDLRWGQLAWRAAWTLGVGLALAKHDAHSSWRTVGHLFVLNPYFNFRHDLYYEAFFAMIVAYYAWPRWRWIGLPVLVWTRQWAWVMAPFLLLDWLWAHPAPGAGQFPVGTTWLRVGRRAAWMVLGTVLVSGMLAWQMWPSIRWPQFAARMVGLAGSRDQFEYGLTLGPLLLLACDRWLVGLAQVTVVAGLLLLEVWRREKRVTGQAPTPPDLAGKSGLIALCVFILMNPFFEVYYWFDAVFWILVAYAFSAPPRPSAVRGMDAARVASR